MVSEKLGKYRKEQREKAAQARAAARPVLAGLCLGGRGCAVSGTESHRVRYRTLPL